MKNIFRDNLFGKVMILIFIALTVGGLAWASIVWSFAATMDYLNSIQTSKLFAFWFGAIIQFGPQAILAVRHQLLTSESTSKKKAEKDSLKNWGLVWLIAFWVFTGIDTITNWGAYINDMGGLAVAFAQGHRIDTALMFCIGFGVTLNEEAMSYFVSVMFNQIAEIWEILGGTPPKFMKLIANTAKTVSGATPTPATPTTNTRKK